MRAYYASKISPNISKMPKEGYIICRNVPIARTGYQEYYGGELDPELDPEKLYKVYRTEEEVFDPKAIASFEGKPVCDDHPTEDVTSENVTLHLKGTTTNVRRGEGDENTLLLADLIIYDQLLIDEVMDGKREVSCGYDCVTEVVGDQLYQKTIRGNHVAIVDAGRAGPDVSIKDKKPTTTTKTISIRRNSRMAKAMTLKDRFERFLGMTKDADPGEAAELLAQMAEDELKSDEEAVPAAKDNDPPKADQESAQVDEGALGPVLEAVKALTSKVDELTTKVDSIQSGIGDNDPQAALEAELAQVLGDETGEAEHTVPAESIDEDPTEDEDPTGDEDPTADEDPTTDSEGTEDEDPTSDNEPGAATTDSRKVLAEIKRMRKVVAGMKDGKAKMDMTRSLLTAARAAKGIKGSGKNGYKQMVDAKAAALRNKAKVATQKDAAKLEAEQQAIYDRLNPHMRKGDK